MYHRGGKVSVSVLREREGERLGHKGVEVCLTGDIRYECVFVCVCVFFERVRLECTKLKTNACYTLQIQPI